MKILMADDNKDIIEIMNPHFKNVGYNVDFAYDGKEALELFNNKSYDLVILDVMMPFIDGFELCKMIRKTSKVPVIMITAKTEDEDFIMGIEIGADDYIVKPFSPKKVMAKIKALVRRLNIGTDEKIINVDNLFINMNDFIVKVDNQIVPLTKKETEILYLLVSNESRVYSREILLDLLWGDDYFGEDRTVDAHIKRLRAKLDLYEHKWDIKTVWGVGYKFEKNME